MFQFDLLTDFLGAPITHLKPEDIQWKTPWFTAPGRSAGWPWSSPPPMVPWRSSEVAGAKEGKDLGEG